MATKEKGQPGQAKTKSARPRDPIDLKTGSKFFTEEPGAGMQEDDIDAQIDELLGRRKKPSMFDFDLNGIAETIAEKLMSGDLKSKDIQALYDSVVDPYRPLLAKLPGLTGMVGKDLGPVIASVAAVFIEAFKSEAVQKVGNEFDKLRANTRMDTLKAYQAAGFTSDQAFQLLMQDVTNLRQMISNASAGVSKKNE